MRHASRGDLGRGMKNGNHAANYTDRVQAPRREPSYIDHFGDRQ
jgi:hypothetical protein